jgi:hypothetical protein
MNKKLGISFIQGDNAPVHEVSFLAKSVIKFQEFVENEWNRILRGYNAKIFLRVGKMIMELEDIDELVVREWEDPIVTFFSIKVIVLSYGQGIATSTNKRTLTLKPVEVVSTQSFVEVKALIQNNAGIVSDFVLVRNHSAKNPRRAVSINTIADFVDCLVHKGEYAGCKIAFAMDVHSSYSKVVLNNFAIILNSPSNVI